MIDVDLTILNTINKAYNKARFLGQTNPDLFRSILEVCIVQEVLEWSMGMDYVTEEVRQLLKNKIDDLILHRCNFEIAHKPSTVYMSSNIPMPENNDFWKLIKLAPVTPITAGTPTLIEVESKKDWEPDSNYAAILVVYSNSKDVYPDKDMNKATVHDKMNLYLNQATGTIWYYGTDNKWHKISDGASSGGVTEDVVKNIVEGYKPSYEYTTVTDTDEKQTTYMSSSLKTDDNNNIGVVTVDEIKEML